LCQIKWIKTVVVKVLRLKVHPKYKRHYKVSRNFKAHDEKNEYHIGDKVIIEEMRPLSKGKRWRVKSKEQIINKKKGRGMIQPQTILRVVDNSGAKVIRCFEYWVERKEDMRSLVI